MSEFRVGDVVRVSRLVKVTHINDEYLHGLAVGEGQHQFPLTYGLRYHKLELVKREWKPKAGDTIDGFQLKNTQWKRGTLLKDEAGNHYGLQADGTWRDLSVDFPDSTALNAEFDLFLDDERFTVLYVA